MSTTSIAFFKMLPLCIAAAIFVGLTIYYRIRSREMGNPQDPPSDARRKQDWGRR